MNEISHEIVPPVWQHMIVPQVWQHVRDVRATVYKTLQTYKDSIRSAAIITAAELVENAMKYGESVSALPSTSLTLTGQGSVIQIEVMNGVTNLDRITDLERHIDDIRNSPNKQELYLNRLRLLLSNPI